MKKLVFLSLIVVMMTLIVSSVYAAPTCNTLPESQWGGPHFQQVCASKGGEVRCKETPQGPRYYCTVPVFYEDLFGKPYELPGKSADFLEILEGATSGEYAESINVPEGNLRIFYTKSNRVEPYWNNDIRGWSANLVNLEYGISKECFGEATAELDMKYLITHAVFQKDDGQYWKKFANDNPIITNCNVEGVIGEEQLIENLSTLTIERISSSQGDPWAFKPILDEEGNILAPSPKLGFELK